MPSSSPYTNKHIKSKRRWRISTVLLALTSLSLGVGIDLLLTQGAASTVSAKGTGDGTSNGGSTTPKDMTVTGDAVDYQYGTVQLEVVRTNGKLAAVNLVQAGANNGREQAFPYLQQYAIEAQGSNFGNLSGATFTTEAFKQALDSAISKLSN